MGGLGDFLELHTDPPPGEPLGGGGRQTQVTRESLLFPIPPVSLLQLSNSGIKCISRRMDSYFPRFL